MEIKPLQRMPFFNLVSIFKIITKNNKEAGLGAFRQVNDALQGGGQALLGIAVFAVSCRFVLQISALPWSGRLLYNLRQ